MQSGRITSDLTGETAKPRGPEGRSWHGRLSLRAKGVLSLIVVVVYVGLMTIMVTEERLKLPSIVQDLERVHRLEEQMVQVNMQVARATMAAGESYYAEKDEVRTKQLFIELSPLQNMLSTLSRHYTPLKRHYDGMQHLAKELAHQPSKAVLAEIRAVLHSLVFDLDQVTQGLRSEKQKLLGKYQLVHDKITLETMFFLFLGVVVVGAVMTIFFTRLTWDIRRVGMRAMAIVKGYRSRPLEVTRSDEVGGLMHAINQMQFELRDRERQLELARQQQFHHEKMAAVGSLAAAVAHEINNPIMAISGLAQVMVDQRAEGMCCPKEGAECVPELILEQARRIALITRQISEFSAPQSAEAQLVDLNALVRNTASFVRFDQRYRRIDLKIELDQQASAVKAVADHITQVLINLMVNAADAVEAAEGKKAEVAVSTHQREDAVEIIVADNGVGMDAETLQHACDEFFTTKPRGKGSGLGLFLTKTLIEQNGGTLRLESEIGKGTRIVLSFPNVEIND
jgi:two-component system, NtrC family, sensor kinase